LRDPKVRWPEKREAKKLMEMCFQLLTFGTIQFLDLPKANKNAKKTGNKHPLKHRARKPLTQTNCYGHDVQGAMIDKNLT
jgi:hypothetical protein